MSVTVKETGQVFKTYNDYLKSFYWLNKVKAFKVHVNFKGFCSVCRKKKKRIDVHHKTYKSIGNESFEDLVIICSECHSRLHPDYGVGGFEWASPERYTSRDNADNILSKLAA